MYMYNFQWCLDFLAKITQTHTKFLGKNSMRLSQLDAGGYVYLFFIEDGHKKFRCGGQNWMWATMVNNKINFLWLN